MMRQPGMNPELDEVKQARQQLAPGKIAGGADEDHDLGILRTYTRRYFCH